MIFDIRTRDYSRTLILEGGDSKKVQITWGRPKLKAPFRLFVLANVLRYRGIPRSCASPTALQFARPYPLPRPRESIVMCRQNRIGTPCPSESTKDLA